VTTRGSCAGLDEARPTASTAYWAALSASPSSTSCTNRRQPAARDTRASAHCARWRLGARRGRTSALFEQMRARMVVRQPARGAARACLRGEVGVVVIGLLAPKWLKQKPHGRELSVTWRECSALTSTLGGRPSSARGRTPRASAGDSRFLTVGRCHGWLRHDSFQASCASVIGSRLARPRGGALAESAALRVWSAQRKVFSGVSKSEMLTSSACVRPE
jgi:hypothetical protein